MEVFEEAVGDASNGVIVGALSIGTLVDVAFGSSPRSELFNKDAQPPNTTLAMAAPV
jgi:hypothetical protein